MGTLVAQRTLTWRQLGDAIKTRRKETPGYSQAELAKRVGVSTGYIGHIETGAVRPSAEVLRLIATHLDIPYKRLATLAEYADEDPVIDTAYDEMRRDVEDLMRRMNEVVRKWGFRLGGGPTHDNPDT